MHWFHTKDGLYFSRAPDNGVRLVKTIDNAEPRADNVVFDTTMSRSAFASVIAFVSESGYTTKRFYDAYAFLQVSE